jgi:hypothetical protein
LHVRTSSVSTTGAFRRRQSRAFLFRAQQAAHRHTTFIHPSGWKACGTKFPTCAKEGAASISPLEGCPPHCVDPSSDDGSSDLRKRLSAELLQSLPQQHRLLGLDALTSLQLTGCFTTFRLRGRCARCHSDLMRKGCPLCLSDRPKSFGTHSPKRVHEPYLTARKPPLPGEVSSQFRCLLPAIQLRCDSVTPVRSRGLRRGHSI